MIPCCWASTRPPAAADVLRLLSSGAAHRHTAATRVNDTSSRSHMVMTCSLEACIVEEGAGVVRRRSKLSLVDLAGSERQKSADTEGERLKEAQAINKSLFTLGQASVATCRLQGGCCAAAVRSCAAPCMHTPCARCCR
jgi:hypothetical protein